MKTLGRDVIIEEESLKSCSWPVNKIVHGNALTTLKKLPDESVDCVITSPPYFGKRDYGEETIAEWKDGEYQLGLEPTPEMFVEHLIEIFKEVKRVLKPHGNVFVVIDDTYAGGGGWNSGGGLSYKDNEWERKHVKNASSKCPTTYIKHIPKKSLCLVPELFSIRMVYDLGFILRNKIVWAKKVHLYKDRTTKGNAMPECLDLETPVIIRENGLIKQRTLEYIYQNRHRLSEIEILTPSGFKKIKNVWETYKEAVEFEAGKVMKIICSLDHRFPISHDRRRKANHVLPVSKIRMEGYNDYLLFKPIKEFIEPKYTELDLVRWANEQDLPYVVIGVARKIKPEGTRSDPSWKELSEKYGYKAMRYDNGYAGRLINLMRQDYTPVKVVLGEGVDYIDRLVSKEGTRIHKDRIPAIIPLDYEFGRFIGLYVAEGTYNDNSNYMKLTFHVNEKELHKFVRDFLYKRFNTETEEVIEGNSLSIVFGNAILKDVLTWIVQGKGKERKLNMDFILNTPEEFRKGILDGYIEGDGSTKDRAGFVVASCSRTLAENIRLLCSSLGIVTSIKEMKQYDKRIGKTYIGYYVWTPYIYRRKDKEGGFKQIPPRNLRKIGKRRMIDIEVEGGLFIIGTGIVTHNSVKDRLTHTWEYIFHFTKKEKYWYDLDAVRVMHKTNATSKLRDKSKELYNQSYPGGAFSPGARPEGHPLGANPGDVLQVNVEPFPEAHFAVFPERLVEFLIKVGCPEQVCKKCGKPRERIVENGEFVRSGEKRVKDSMGISEQQKKFGTGYHLKYTIGWTDCGCNAGWESGIVLDPFLGSGTTALVALKMNRRFIGVELNREYCEMALRRIKSLLTQFTLLDYLG